MFICTPSLTCHICLYLQDEKSKLGIVPSATSAGSKNKVGKEIWLLPGWLKVTHKFYSYMVYFEKSLYFVFFIVIRELFTNLNALNFLNKV